MPHHESSDNCHLTYRLSDYCSGDVVGSSHCIKEPVSTLHRLSQRRRRTYSDTDSCNDIPLEDPDRPVHCSKNTLNGDLASATIPEESRLMAKKKSELEDTLPSFSS
ncbi:Pleckstrin y domain-containing A member 3 [Saguinus oedipus]|uniref:Pleckstrin y domain-containing A member 3 n=1 Tax=Saguinus oedipus TaxID=9490 RepID=A0ABQ9VH98_SAGOE|nr:Pleckstrin y domain-containing A member 3 [Saguinus oedipus]